MCLNFYFKFSLSFFLFEDFLFIFACFWVSMLLCLCVLIQPISAELLFTLFNSMYYECVLFAIAATATVVLCVFELCMFKRMRSFFSFLLLDSVQFIGSKFIGCQYGLAFKFFFHSEFASSNRQVKNTHSYLLADLRMSFLLIPFDRIEFISWSRVFFLLVHLFSKRVQSFKSLQFARTNLSFPHAHIFNQWICKKVNLYGNFNFPSKSKWVFSSICQ